MCRTTSRAAVRWVVVFCAVLVVLIFIPLLGNAPALARDADGAKKSIDAAKSDLDSGNPSQAATDIQLAEAELDGITDAAAKADLTKQVAAMKKQLADTQANAANADLIQTMDGHLKNLKEYLDDHGGFGRELKETQDALAKPDVKAALGDAKIQDYQRQMGVLAKVEKQKWATRAHGEIEAKLKEGEDRLGEVQKLLADPNSSDFDKNTGMQSVQGAVKQVRFLMQDLPADDSAVAGYTARAKQLEDTINSAASAGDAAATLENLKRSWESHKLNFEGYEAETTGPTFAQVLHTSSEEVYRLGCPKTVKMISAANQWLDNFKDQIKQYASDPKISAVVASVKQQRDAGLAKIAKIADGILTEAEKAQLKKDDADRLASFARDDLRIDLEGYDQLPALQARATALSDKVNQGAAANAAAQEELFKKLTDSAAAAWPAMAAKFSPEDGFDPSKASDWKGKTIRFKNARNRMAWDFVGNDFGFAMNVNGMPVAGNYAPEIRAAMNDVTQRTGKDIPDHEDWDVIAIVQGTGQVAKRDTATLTAPGAGEIARAEGSHPVDCAVIKIVALHAGPVAAAAGQGAADENGKVAAPLGVTDTAGIVGSGVSFIAWVIAFAFHLFVCAIGLAGAAACYLKAKPSAAAQAVGAQGAAPLANVNKNLDVVGVIFAVIGALWLLRGFIYRNLFPAAALILCGAYAASDLLQAKGILPAETARKMKPHGVQIAVISAVIMVLHLFIGGRFWFI